MEMGFRKRRFSHGTATCSSEGVFTLLASCLQDSPDNIRPGRLIQTDSKGDRMKSNTLSIAALALGLATIAAVSLHRAPTTQFTDFGMVVTPRGPVYPAELPPVSAASVKEFRIPIRDATV